MREFTNQDGRTVRVSDARGKAVVLSFLYTRCPVPTMCPLITEKLVEFQNRLPGDLRDRVVLLTVTLDPSYDTPSVLKEYAARYGADTSRWHFVTTNATETRESTDCCGVAFKEESPGVVAHTMNTMVIAPDGSVAEEHSGSGWTVDALLQSVKRALEAGRS